MFFQNHCNQKQIYLNSVYISVYIMVDIFDNTILCKNCKTNMKKAKIILDGKIVQDKGKWRIL